MNRLYSSAPDGYCGDEDNGQTSAWYVFSALGFYPVCPGSGEYAVGAPLFEKAVINLENGRSNIKFFFSWEVKGKYESYCYKDKSPENLLFTELSTNNFPSEFSYSSASTFGACSDIPTTGCWSLIFIVIGR